MAELPTTTTSTPNTKNPAYLAQVGAWTLVDDVLEGTTKIRARGETYTPRAQGESEERYKRRLDRSRFYNVYRRILVGLNARVFRRSPKLAEDASQLLRDHAEDIDGQGTHFAVFMRRAHRQGFHHGHGAILVDAPPDPRLGRKPTLSDVKRMGLRPFWVPIRADQILNFRTTRVGGNTTLAQITIREQVTQPDGQFGDVEVTKYRVFKLGMAGVEWEVWRDGKDRPVIEDSGVMTGVSTIPVVPYYANEPEGWLQTRPCLYDLAEANLDHYAVQSDHRYSLHVASIPIPVIKEAGAEDSVTISVENGIRLRSEFGDAFFMEHEGKALNETRQEMADLEARMVFLGLQATVSRTKQSETAEAKRIDNMEQESILAVSARGLQDAAEQAWKIHAQMVGEASPSLIMNLDFDGMTMTPDQFRAVVEGWEKGVYTLGALWDMLDQGGILPEDFDRRREEVALAEAAMQMPTIPDPAIQIPAAA